MKARLLYAPRHADIGAPKPRDNVDLALEVCNKVNTAESLVVAAFLAAGRARQITQHRTVA